MFRLALASVFLLSSVANSQTAIPNPNVASTTATTSLDLPEAPKPSSCEPDRPDTHGNLSGTGVATPMIGQYTSSTGSTMDRQFILLNGLSALALAGDVETTIHAVGGETKANELNPLFGAHPGRPRLYGITLPLNAVSFYLSYHAKKTMPTRSIWKIGPGLSIGVHTAAAINNLIVAHP